MRRSAGYLAGLVNLGLGYLRGGLRRVMPGGEHGRAATLGTDPGGARTDDEQRVHVDGGRVQFAQRGDAHLLADPADAAPDDDRRGWPPVPQHQVTDGGYLPGAGA